MTKPFVRLQFKDALKILQENQSKLKSAETETGSITDLNRESEIFLTKYFDNSPVFITDFPAQSKPFYMFTYEEGGQELVRVT